MYYMMLQLIDDVNKALDAECYFSALSLVLTFPDVCGQAEYYLNIAII